MVAVDDTAVVLAELASHESFAVRRVTAGRADLPHQLYEQLAADLWGLADLRLPVTRHPNCPADLLHHLAQHGATELRELIAAHPNAEVGTLLLCLADERARPVAAEHPRLPVATIVELIADPEAGPSAAQNPSLPVEVMADLLSPTT